MNRRLFVRWLGLAPTATILPLAGIQTASARWRSGRATVIEGGRITANAITARHMRIADADTGSIVAGRVRSGDRQTCIDGAAGTITLMA